MQNNDLYSDLLLEEYKNLHNYGEMKDADLILEGSNSSCGDSVRIYLKLSGDKIVDISWTGNGCVISQVAMSLMAKKIKNAELRMKNINDITKKDLLDLLGLKQISPGREKCLMLGLKTIKNEE